MRIGLALVAICALVSGCSSSSVKLVQRGDPSVCAKSDVEDLLVSSIKDGAYLPKNNGFFSDYASLVKGWLSQINFFIDTVTSTNADPTNGRVSCSAVVHIKSDKNEQTQSYNVGYTVSSDLSQNKLLLSSSASEASGAVSSLIGQISSADVDKAKALAAADLVQKNKAQDDAWASSHASLISAKKAYLNAPYSNGRFSEDEKNAIFLAAAARQDSLDRMHMGNYDSTDLERITKEMHDRGLCNPQYETWQHCNSQDAPSNLPVPN